METPKKFGFSPQQYTLITVGVLTGYLLYSVWFPFSLPVFLIVMLAVGIVSLFSPAAGLISAFVATMWFERFFTLAPITLGSFALKLYPLDIVLGFVTLGVVGQLFRHKLFWKPNKLDWAILFFGVVCTLGYIHSLFLPFDKALAFGTYKNYFLYVIVYFLAAILFPTRESWKPVVRWLVVGGVGTFFFLFYGLVMHQGLWSEVTPLSTPGTRLIAGTHVFYLVMFACILAARLLWPTTEEQPVSRENQLTSAHHAYGTVAAFVALVLCGVALSVSLVRHLWLAVAVLMGLWFVVTPRQYKRRLVGLLVFLVICSGLFVALYSRDQSKIVSVYVSTTAPAKVVSTTINENVSTRATSFTNLNADSSAEWRLSAWGAGLLLWKQHPLFGTGLGTTVAGNVGLWNYVTPARELHNNYLGIAVQLGLLGVVAVAVWFGYVLVLMYQAWRRAEKNATDNRFVFSVGSVILIFMMVFFISVYWDINYFNIWWWLSLAALRSVAFPVEKKV